MRVHGCGESLEARRISLSHLKRAAPRQERDPHLHSPHLRSGQVCMQVQVSALRNGRDHHMARDGPQDDAKVRASSCRHIILLQ